MVRSTRDDPQAAGVDNAIDGQIGFTSELLCRDLDEGAEAYLGADREVVRGTDVVPLLSATPESMRETLWFTLKTGRPATVECRSRATGTPGDGWAVPVDDGLSLLLVVDTPTGAVPTGEGGVDGDAEWEGSLLDHTESLAATGGWEYDVDSGRLRWTSGTRRIHGVGPEYEPTIHRALSFYHPDDRETVTEVVDRAITEREPYDIEARILTDDGDRKWVRSIGEPVVAEGAVTAVRGALRDITEQREREEHIALLRRAIDTAPVGITLADMQQPDEPLMYVNEAFEDLTGYTEADSIGRNCRFLQGEATDPETVATLRAAIDNRETATVELRNYRADGSLFWNRLTIAPVRNAEEVVTHYVGFQVDVTDRVENERRLRTFRHAVESSGNAIFITDTDGVIEFVNEAFEEITGYTSAEAVGQTPRMLNSGRMSDDYFDRLWSEISAGNTFEGRVIDQHRDGRLYHAHQTVSPLTDDEGAVTGYVAVQTDITERIERDQQIAVLDRVLRHNLRNDMNVILGHADHLRSELDGPLAQSAENIYTNGNDLLQLAEKERAVVEHLSSSDRIRSQDVRALLAAIVSDTEAAHPDASITVSCPDDARLEATQQIENALSEFVDNAVIHTDAESPTVDIEVSVDEMVHVRIADRGPGIPDRERELVTTDHGPDSLYHADGIGLWLASWIITRSGGALDFEDRDGGGTVVHVRLPRSTATE